MVGSKVSRCLRSDCNIKINIIYFKHLLHTLYILEGGITCSDHLNNVGKWINFSETFHDDTSSRITIDKYFITSASFISTHPYNFQSAQIYSIQNFYHHPCIQWKYSKRAFKHHLTTSTTSHWRINSRMYHQIVYGSNITEGNRFGVFRPKSISTKAAHPTRRIDETPEHRPTWMCKRLLSAPRSICIPKNNLRDSCSSDMNDHGLGW